MPAPAQLRFDFRVPEFAKTPKKALYDASLEMASYADEHGFQAVILSEHHCLEDGYLPSPLVVGAAIAARTKRIAISVSALLAPLHDPVRLAEDLAVLDILSGGRFSITAGLGYRPIEYRATSKEFTRRGKLLDELLETLLAAWTGEPFEYRGQTIRVTPTPISKPHPFVVVGGSTPAAAKRAARFGLPFGPPIHDEELNALYLSECKRLGVARPFIIDPVEPWMLFVSRDPDRTWSEIGAHYLHDATTYASWQRPEQRSYQHSRATTVEALRAEGKYRVLTPEECIAYASTPGAAFRHFPLGGGIPPELGWESLELFANEVMPTLARADSKEGSPA